MLSQLLARVFKLRTRRNCAPPRRLRLNTEALEGREVPAALTWVGDGTYPFMNPINWSPSQAPASGDDIYFSSSGSPVSATAMTPPTVQFNSIHLQSGYPGTVSLYTPGAFNDIELRSGAIALTGTDISVANDLTWTGGTLHNATHLRTVTVLGGATATIDPGVGNTIVTGANLALGVNAAGVGAQGVVNPGTVEFRNGAGAIIGGGFSATIDAKLTVTGNVNLTKGGRVTVNQGGEFRVSGPGIRYTELPIWVEGGRVRVDGGGTLAVDGAIPGTGASVFMNGLPSGRIYLQAGSRIEALWDVSLQGGTFATLPGSVGGTQTATVETTAFKNNGADIVINDDAFTPPGSFHISGELKIEGKVVWSDGAYRPVVNAGDNSCDNWVSTLEFAVEAGADLAPGTVNGTPPRNATFLFLESKKEIVGTPPAVVGGQYTVTLEADPITMKIVKWHLKKL